MWSKSIEIPFLGAEYYLNNFIYFQFHQNEEKSTN